MGVGCSLDKPGPVGGFELFGFVLVRVFSSSLTGGGGGGALQDLLSAVSRVV